ncbi:hypothetical protein TRIUR3_29820 [Triticum urartu]|uniref:Uncharacterized protein n=1 Tax=Triticum urartu TaxID=4572 RepID=M7ZWT0_TRIUA|nr:hypothetical protein TRIUR3_29820 [Triticum urartu]
MEPPKRQLALTGAGAGREEAKRLRVGGANPSAAGWGGDCECSEEDGRVSKGSGSYDAPIGKFRGEDGGQIGKFRGEAGGQIGKFRREDGEQEPGSAIVDATTAPNDTASLRETAEHVAVATDTPQHHAAKYHQPTQLEVFGRSVVRSTYRPGMTKRSTCRSEPYQEGATLSEPNANIRLRFLDGLKTPIYTDKIIASESNAAIRIGVFDGDKMINEGPLSKAKVEILVLRGDFCSDGQESWTEEEFNSHIAQGRHRQGSVLGGDCSAWLNNGEASLGKIRFREGSSRTPSRKFIVGGRVCTNRKIGGIRVQEAVMEPVTVLDRRNEANEKRHPPRLDDEVYRLEEISKDGIYHRRLKDAQIFKVEDFLKALNKDADELREMVLQIKKRSNAWERMVKHARECCLADRPELKAYHSVDGNVVIFFNCVHDLVGAIFYGVYISRDNFDPAKKAQAYELKRGTAANENQLQYRINNITEPSHQNEYIHGDQSTVNTHYYQGESILPVGQQQPTIFTGELLHWPYERSGQVNIHSQMQAPMSMDGGSVMQASTSVQHNLLSQQFAPTQVQETYPLRSQKKSYKLCLNSKSAKFNLYASPLLKSQVARVFRSCSRHQQFPSPLGAFRHRRGGGTPLWSGVWVSLAQPTVQSRCVVDGGETMSRLPGGSTRRKTKETGRPQLSVSDLEACRLFYVPGLWSERVFGRDDACVLVARLSG